MGDKVAVNARLISAETGAQVWADRFDGERGRLGELHAEFVSRLANSLGWELLKAESLRAMRERPNNPDAADLAMRGEIILRSSPNGREEYNEARALFERALALDPQNLPAMIGLTNVLTDRLIDLASPDPEKDVARAEETINAALALQPDNSSAHRQKGYVQITKRQYASAISEFEKAIAEDPNNAYAHADASFWKVAIGTVEFTGIEKAFRLSPHDPSAPWWQFDMCRLDDHLAQWEQAVEWCNKAVAGKPGFWWPIADLAIANAWAGHDREAKEAVAQLQKVYPGFTVQGFLGFHWTDNPTFNAQYERMAEGLRKAGLPEK